MTSPAVCSALYILDSNFKVLLSRDWRGDTSPSHVEAFAAKVQEAESESEQRPIIEDPDLSVTYSYVQHNNLYLLALTKSNANAVALLTFLHRIIAIFKHYFNELEEESIRDNFVIIYELLDEICDNGYTLFTKGRSSRVHHRRCTSAQGRPKLPWRSRTPSLGRSEEIKYQKNEVFLDVIESVNVVVKPPVRYSITPRIIHEALASPGCTRAEMTIPLRLAMLQATRTRRDGEHLDGVARERLTSGRRRLGSPEGVGLQPAQEAIQVGQRVGVR